MLLVVLFAGCIGRVMDDVFIDDIADTGPGSGTCAEVSRDPVADPTAAASGFGFSEADWSASLVASTGQIAWADGTSSDVTISFVDRGPVNVVRYEAASNGPIAAVNGRCPAPRYETTVDVAVDAGADLGATVSATITTDALTGGDLSGRAALASVTGTRRPTSFDPSIFSQAWLGFDASRSGSSWSGPLGWYAANDTSGDTGVDPAIGEAAGQLAVAP